MRIHLSILFLFFGLNTSLALSAQNIVPISGADGSLSKSFQIINKNFTAKKDAPYPTKAAMISDTLVEGRTYSTQGYYNPGAGQADYIIKSLASYGRKPDEKCSFSVNGGDDVAVLQYKDKIDITQCGADISLINNAPNINAAKDYASFIMAPRNAVVFVPSGEFKVTESVYINKPALVLKGTNQQLSIIAAGIDGVDIIKVQSDEPFNSILRNIGISDLQLKYAEGSPWFTSGVGLSITNVTRSKFVNIKTSGLYGGIYIKGGGEMEFSGLRLDSDQHFKGFAEGSFLFKVSPFTSVEGLKNTAGTTISDFNMRGSNQNGYLNNCVVIEASDGLWFTTGHIGFCTDASLLVAPTLTNAHVLGLNFVNVHFDGGYKVAKPNARQRYGIRYTLPTGYTGACTGHSFTNCQVSLCLADGYYFDSADTTTQHGIKNIVISGGRINSIGGWGINIKKGENYSITGLTYYNCGLGCLNIGYANFVNSDSIYSNSPIGVLLGGNCTRCNIAGIFSSITSQDVVITTTNQDNKVTGLTNKTYTIASTADISLPLPHKNFVITGKTTINTITSEDNLLFREINLLFTGNCSVTDNAIKLSDAFTSTAGTILTLVYDGSNWVEKSRSSK